MEVQCRNKVFDVFEISEADNLGIEYSADWRNASKGDWVLTADEKVLQVLGRRDYKKDRKKKIYLIRTGYGETPTYKSQIYSRKQPDYEWDTRYKKDTVKTAMSKIMKERLESVGIDDEYVAKRYKKFIEDNDAPASTRLQALNRVSDIMGHIEKKESNTEHTLVMLSDGDKKLLAQHKRKLPDKQLGEMITNGSNGTTPKNINSA